VSFLLLSPRVPFPAVALAADAAANAPTRFDRTRPHPPHPLPAASPPPLVAAARHRGRGWGGCGGCWRVGFPALLQTGQPGLFFVTPLIAKDPPAPAAHAGRGDRRCGRVLAQGLRKTSRSTPPLNRGSVPVHGRSGRTGGTAEAAEPAPHAATNSGRQAESARPAPPQRYAGVPFGRMAAEYGGKRDFLAAAGGWSAVAQGPWRGIATGGKRRLPPHTPQSGGTLCSPRRPLRSPGDGTDPVAGGRPSDGRPTFRDYPKRTHPPPIWEACPCRPSNGARGAPR